ncbi:purine-nucleoside phosphorylase [Terriglobus roseus]|uniref:Purine nucleoside permease n=1 Tax=Terriglobus roseus TaxID=392734 RepID=A0A1G7NK79_9BACT|nr:purine nucleoside permease [Terriglobus roseus]SDF74366.1 Purine nucleoside permease [Terriglobus roseus]
MRLRQFFSLLPLLCSVAASSQQPVLRPKVVIVSYFEVGNDTGDRPGELQLWVERDHLDRVIEVPGMTRAVRANADGTEIAVAVGPGNIRPGVNLMALGSDPRFDLRQAHWLLNGIAGISPADGTIGDAVWTDFIINGDLAKEIDPRESPKNWPDGFLSLDGVTQSDPKGGANWEDDVRTWKGADAHTNRRGNVIRMNTTLMQWAYTLTRDAKLPEDDAMRKLRLQYKGFAGTAREPKVITGANMATEIFWHGAKMDAWAHRWVQFETDGVAHLGTTAMNDTGSMLALWSLTQQGKADWNRALLLRTASNFDMPAPGVTAADNLASEKHGAYTGYLPALEAAYTVGHRVVTEWMKM